MHNKVAQIVDLLKTEADYDFSGCSYDMLYRRLSMRLLPSACENLDEYYDYLIANPNEFKFLLQALTIKVSHFFRNPLDFEIINRILRNMISQKLETNSSLRIWSAGCASGEEPYSIAILLNESFQYEKVKAKIFATDIDPKILEIAKSALYSEEAVKEVKTSILNKYFVKENDLYRLIPEIKNLVSFFTFNQLNSRSPVPPESIFGSFDLILCRNLLIYYNSEYQKIILERLYNALNVNGYLMLGEAENIIEELEDRFHQVAPFSKIFKKVN